MQVKCGIIISTFLICGAENTNLSAADAALPQGRNHCTISCIAPKALKNINIRYIIYADINI